MFVEFTPVTWWCSAETMLRVQRNGAPYWHSNVLLEGQETGSRGFEPWEQELELTLFQVMMIDVTTVTIVTELKILLPPFHPDHYSWPMPHPSTKFHENPFGCFCTDPCEGLDYLVSHLTLPPVSLLVKTAFSKGTARSIPKVCATCQGHLGCSKTNQS